jgi:hypothetical protein
LKFKFGLVFDRYLWNLRFSVLPVGTGFLVQTIFQSLGAVHVTNSLEVCYSLKQNLLSIRHNLLSLRQNLSNQWKRSKLRLKLTTQQSSPISLDKYLLDKYFTAIKKNALGVRWNLLTNAKKWLRQSSPNTLGRFDKFFSNCNKIYNELMKQGKLVT